jgi:enterochelin esterase-like enzyme
VTDVTHPALRVRLPRLLVIGAAVLASVAFVALGGRGLYSYVDNFWVYRGFAPPSDPASVTIRGATERFYVASAAIGGRSQPVDVYLPPGYATHRQKRYPVFYLLHGVPGRPGAFLQTVRMGVVEDILVARHKIQPMILVMPFGSTGSFTDKEWANGIGRNEGWETFLANDVVRAVDARYRTIPDGAHRALGGLSEGGYGALNIGIHHPGLFRVLESWSGYAHADNIASIFGHRPSVLRLNSPADQLAARAAALRAHHDFVWLYSGATDPLRADNQRFAQALRRNQVPFRFSLPHGGHDWALWRGQASNALLAASRHLAHGA